MCFLKKGDVMIYILVLPPSGQEGYKTLTLLFNQPRCVVHIHGLS